MDVIARTAFGLQVDSQKCDDGENEFVAMAKRSMDMKMTNPMVLCAGTIPLFLHFINESKWISSLNFLRVTRFEQFDMFGHNQYIGYFAYSLNTLCAEMYQIM